jgi:hypothetical protein
MDKTFSGEVELANGAAGDAFVTGWQFNSVTWGADQHCRIASPKPRGRPHPV